MLTGFDHHIVKTIRGDGLENSSMLLAVSGGLDSMSLLWVMSRTARLLKIKLRVAYVHHGLSVDPKISSFRNRAGLLVKKTASNLGIEFVTNEQLPIGLRSEEDFRKYRYECLNQWRRPKEWVVLGHHAQDLFETRLLRLMRGTGLNGLPAIKKLDQRTARYRPFLETTKNEIRKYAKDSKGLSFIEDPSNADRAYLRNWLRAELLPAIELKRPGSIGNLAQSIHLIIEESLFLKNAQKRVAVEKHVASFVKNGSVALAIFCDLTSIEQRYFIRKLAKKMDWPMTQTQTLEIIKQLQPARLDRVKKVHRFECAQVNWVIQKSHISATKVR